MPRLWTREIETHREAVREAILDGAAGLVSTRGLRGVTMSRIAAEAGIARATLYRYFADVDAILRAWHERQIAGHLALLASERDLGSDPEEKLRGVLHAYAQIRHGAHGHHDADLAAVLHGHDHVAVAETQVRRIIRDLLAEGAASGVVRDDITSDELATYCLHALGAANELHSRAAVRRLVAVTLDGLGSGPTATRSVVPPAATKH